jgi:hypothetical protein
MTERRWIEERRSILLKEIVHQMLLGRLVFDEIYDQYKKTGHVDYQKIETWIGTELNKGALWNLKDTSHLLFRDNASKSFFYERVFDWTLGSIFHEGMKLKEDGYLVEIYEKDGAVITDSANVPEDVNIQELQEEYKRIISRARHSTAEDIENLRFLFFKGMEQLRRLIRHFKDNGLLIRFLVENESLHDSVFGKGSLTNLFGTMYAGGLEEAYIRVAKNYREGGWYDEALMILARGLRMNPDNQEMKREAEEIRRIMAGSG